MMFFMALVFFVSLAWAEDNDLLANLPPDPGAAGKLTLAGIDSDGDGVRDDVQRWIALTYPNSQKTRAALTQGTKTMQKFLLEAANAKKSYVNAVQMAKDYECLSYVNMDASYAISREHQAIFLDTNVRSRAWFQADHHLSGSMFKSSDFADWKKGCNFNPDAMPN